MYRRMCISFTASALVIFSFSCDGFEAKYGYMTYEAFLGQ